MTIPFIFPFHQILKRRHRHRMTNVKHHRRHLRAGIRRHHHLGKACYIPLVKGWKEFFENFVRAVLHDSGLPADGPGSEPQVLYYSAAPSSCSAFAASYCLAADAGKRFPDDQSKRKDG